MKTYNDFILLFWLYVLMSTISTHSTAISFVFFGLTNHDKILNFFRIFFLVHKL